MKTLNLTNRERLEKYPDGQCPLCGAQHWLAYSAPEENEYGIECSDCGEQFEEDY